MSTWKPILVRGPLALRARRIVEHAADSLRSWAKDGRRGKGGDPSARSASVGSGLSGAALLAAELAYENGGEDEWARAYELLGLAIDRLGVAPSPFLYTGAAGLGWAMAHIDRLAGTKRAGAAFEDIDSALESLVESSSPPLDSQLVYGLAGIGVYWLGRLPARRARRSLGTIVKILAATAERSDAGIAWRVSPALLPPGAAQEYPHGRFDLGMAHGQPGVISFLSLVHRAGVEPALSGALLRDAVRWLLAQRAAGRHSSFPKILGPGQRAVMDHERLAWCYGDLGISVALLHAGRALARRAWITEALNLARRAASWRGPSTGIVDAMVCHGSAGAAHLFHRLYRECGEPRFREAALHWLDRVCASYDPQVSRTGFEFWIQTAESKPAVHTEVYGLLNGIVGVALVLQAAMSRHEPRWDRLLLVS